MINPRNVSSLAMEMKNLDFGSRMIRIKRLSEAGTLSSIRKFCTKTYQV
jgi:hypothetical protein